ncbi:3-oxoacyl-ACP reductase [Clostridia bacterium]|nr:3-oxoacyl-ACP reductase [Clostridia bacterium]
MKVLVTGAGRGIGKAVAEKFYNCGYEVYSNYLNTFPVFGKPIKADVSDILQVEKMFSEIGEIDILVNNAGVTLSGLFQNIQNEEILRLFNVNVFGTFNCTKFALPSMISKKKGKIINIASIWGEIGASCEVHYSASKAAIIGFTKALAKEVAPSDITVNCVSPGVIDTDMVACYEKSELKKDIPLNRLGTPKEVAKAVYFIAENDYITGHILSINGGFWR